MAKQMTWELTKGILEVNHTDGQFKQSFDLTDMFPDFLDYNTVQANIIGYGLKQKLADSCAKSADEKLTAEERRDTMTAVWDRLIAGEWNVKGISRQTVKKKIDTAIESAEEDELATMVKLEIITQAQMDAELGGRTE